MIRIKLEVEEQVEETEPLPIESNNFDFSSDNNNVVVATKVLKKVVPKKKLKLDNSTTNSFVAFGSKSIKTEPTESLLLSSTTQLNNLVIQNIIQNTWTTNQQSIPNLNPNLGDSDTTITTERFPACPRAGLGRRAKLGVCYSVPKKSEVPRKMKKESSSSSLLSSTCNLESTNNDNEQYSVSGSISCSGPSSSTSSSSAVVVAAPSRWQLWFANATPEQREQKRLKEREKFRRHREKETEEQRERRMERMREYDRNRRPQLLDSGTPEQQELRRSKKLGKYRRYMENESEEQRKRRLKYMRQYKQTVRKQRRKLETKNNDTGREGKEKSHLSGRITDFGVMDNSESSIPSLNQLSIQVGLKVTSFILRYGTESL